MRTPDKTFAGAIDEYKRKNSLSEDDAHFLDRLRNDAIGFEPHSENESLVERLVIAWRVAKSMMKMREEDRLLDEEVEEIRRHARALKGLGTPVGKGPIRLKHGLAFIDERKGPVSYVAIEVASELPDDQPFPQLTRQSSVQNVFIAQVSAAIEDIFGKPRDKAVAHLVDIAFETRKLTDPERVRAARKRSGQLRGK
jgi:hypothetical protein